MADLASLGVQVQATGVDQTTAGLNGLAASADRAQASTDKLSRSTAATSTELSVFQQKAVQAAMAQLGLTEAQARVSLGFEAAAAGAAKTSRAADEVTAALGRTHGASASVTRELLTLGREAANGNWSRFGGSLTLLGQYTGTLQKLMNPLALSIIGVTAATVGFFVAVESEKSRLDELGDIASGVGAAMGLTAASLEDAAHRGARAGQESAGAANKQALALAETGKLSADVIAGVIGITREYAEATGEKAAEASKELGRAFADPAKGAAELDNKLHFLNDTQLRHIEQLAREGERTQAQTELLNALKPVLDENAQHVGGLAGAWNSVASAAANAWHWIVQAAAGGPVLSAQQDLDKAQARLATLQQNNASPAMIQDQLRAIDTARANLERERQRITQASGNADSTAAGRVADSITPGAGTLEKFQGDLAVVTRRVNELKAAHQEATPEFQRLAEAQDRLTHATETYVTPAQKAHDVAVAQAEAARAHTAAGKALAAQHLAAAQAEGEAITTAELGVKTTDAATLAYDRKSAATKRDPVAERIGALRAEVAGNRDIAEAYDLSTAAGFRATAVAKALSDAAKTKGDVARFERLEIDALVTTTEKEAAKSIEVSQAKNAAQREANRIMAQTGVSQAEANRQVGDAVELDKLRAAQANASGVDILILGQQIRQTADAQVAKNEADRDAFAIQQHNAATNQLDQLKLEGQLIGASNRERTVRLALLKEELALKGQGITDPTDPRFQQGMGDAAAVAKQTADNAAAQERYNEDLQATVDLLGEAANHAQSLSQGLQEAFGGAGKGVADVTTALLQQSHALARLAADRQAYVDKWKGDADPRKLAEFDRQAADIQISGYGDVLAAAKGAFSQQSEGYRILSAAEGAFRAIEIANSIRAVAVHTAEVGAKITGNTGLTLSNLAAGASQMFADLGPLGFAAVAAMTAVMAGFGFSGGSAGVAPGATDAADRQKAQGTGSVLGDATAKSASIANSLALVAKNTNTDLEYSNKMLTALRSIDANIGSLTAALARNLSVGQLSGASGLGASSAGPGLLTRLLVPLANVFPGLFGSTSTTTLQDKGLQFGAQSIGDIIAKGIQGSLYQQTSTETKSKFFGLTVSDKFSQNTATSGLDGQIAGDLTRVIASLRSGVLAAAGVLGIDGAQATLDALQLNLGKVSLKDLKGQDLSDAINAIFSKAADDMAADVAPITAEFQKAGEGAFETLTRLAKDYQVVDVTLESIGKTFGAVGLASVAAREDLVGMFGSLDDFTQAVGDFSSNFLTDAERLAPVQAAVGKAMHDLGLDGVTTKDAFKSLVLGLDLTTASGRAMYAQLLQIAPAFAKVADAAGAAVKTANDNVSAARDALSKARDAAIGPYQTALTAVTDRVNAARNALTAAYQRESQALSQTVTQFQNFGTTLRAFRAGLDTGPNALLSPEAAYAAAKSKLSAAEAAVASGNGASLTDLQGTEQEFLDASKAYYASSAGYFQDAARVKALTDKGIGLADQSVTAAEAQLADLNKLVSGIIAVSDNTETTAKALGDLNDAIRDQTLVQGVIDAINAQVDPLVTINTSVLTIPAAIAALQSALATQSAAELAVSDTAAAAAQAAALAALAAIGGGLGSPANDNRTPFAIGGAISRGLVTRPTAFAMGGGKQALLGEAGQGDAVLPLVNVGGRLGVQSSGGGHDPEVLKTLQRIERELKADKVQRAAIHGQAQETQTRTAKEIAKVSRTLQRRPAA